MKAIAKEVTAATEEEKELLANETVSREPTAKNAAENKPAVRRTRRTRAAEEKAEDKIEDKIGEAELSEAVAATETAAETAVAEKAKPTKPRGRPRKAAAKPQEDETAKKTQPRTADADEAVKNAETEVEAEAKAETETEVEAKAGTEAKMAVAEPTKPTKPRSRPRKKKNDETLRYIQEELMIQNKAGQMIPLKLNPLQLRLYQEIQRQRASGQPVRIIILKARQIGFSTATAALFYQRAATMPNHNGMIVAHKADASTNIFNKSKLFWEMSRPEVRPLKKTSNAKELLFENPSTKQEDKLTDPGLRSRILIETAGNRDAGRSATIHDLHLSELAFWPYAEQTLISLMQAVPNLPETTIIIESTANGVGGAFYKEWRRAKAGQSAFVPLFFPWWEHQEYCLHDPDFLPTPEEEALAQTYGLSLDQLAWRRWCIRANCGGDENVFAQEYPANDEEAFLLSGRPVFDMRALLRAEQAAPEAQLGRVAEINGLAQFTADSSYLRLYHPPRNGAEYVIGIDVAEGLAGGDWSVMAVLERNSLELAALWRGHIDPDLLGREAVLLARYYQGALLAPEANNHGIAVINAIKRENYGRMYRQRDPDTGKLSERWGFSTTSRSKPLAINLLAKLIREDAERLQDKLLIGECMSYAYDDKGHTNAQPGCHDDCVMAMAIAVAVCCEQPTGPRLTEADWTRLYGSCSTTGY